ncbi:hypothetical protein EVAR_32643_1 [Eumeta japonica]|uniref:Uncharacterized protein n=1 Tax=Eumeta variegata TaxID=151549 RepID=A0A4C1WS28_EUMVA|nr:hypothetical protein EVAR_32643_1 [Eumeta japonica]
MTLLRRGNPEGFQMTFAQLHPCAFWPLADESVKAFGLTAGLLLCCWRFLVRASLVTPCARTYGSNCLYWSVGLRDVPSELLNRSRCEREGRRAYWAPFGYSPLASSKLELGVIAELQLKTGQRAKSRKGPEPELKAGPGPKLRTGLGLKMNVKMGTKFKV